ncbi:MAG: SPFH domain-containing protein [Proteobacteria bacterium]|nr:SPFH domain-containing protein [Pseudomonadota bacterium]
METDNTIFLEVLEWFDDTGKEIVHRVPEKGSGEIKYGAQLTVRESQAAVFFYQGRALDAFGAGRHMLSTANIPIIIKILSIPWGMRSPLRAEVYFVNMKEFPNLKWGTRDPVAFRDSELGLIRLRAFGVFKIRVLQPVLFINTLTGTQGIYTMEEIEEYLGSVIVSRFNDYLGEHLDTVFNLPGKYEVIAQGLIKELKNDFDHFGLGLSGLYINSITPPQEVQKAIDDKSKLGIFDDLNRLLQMKAAMALEKSSETQGEAASVMGMGFGLMMPAMFANTFKGNQGADQYTLHCPDCKQTIPEDAKFCHHCGHQILIFNQCSKCGKNLPPNARFCPICGTPASEKPQPVKCSHCATDNLPKSIFCNQCGGKLS